jgi:hypothetical protein
MTAVLPLGASPQATLEVVRQLLHNPPGSHASPSATEQWHHDVDQLIVNAINTLPHGGVQVNCLHRTLEPSVAHSRSPATHSHPPSASRMSSVLVASLTTVDLRVKLEHQRSGEDGHITIKRQWERHGYQGRNLNGDFDAVDTTPMRQAARPPTPPAGSGGGCMALAPHRCMVVWPRKFCPHLSEKYEGSVNPIEFPQIYSTSILGVGGDEAIMANYFPVALTDMARSWLMNLPEGSLTSWEELRR